MGDHEVGAGIESGEGVEFGGRGGEGQEVVFQNGFLRRIADVGAGEEVAAGDFASFHRIGLTEQVVQRGRRLGNGETNQGEVGGVDHGLLFVRRTRSVNVGLNSVPPI